MRRLKAYLILTTGIVGFCIMPSDNLLQSFVGVSMFAIAVWLGGHNSQAIYDELNRLYRWLGTDRFTDESENGNGEETI